MSVKFWTCEDDAEELMETDRDEAIESYLDRFRPGIYRLEPEQERIDQFVKALPETLEVYGYERQNHLDAEFDGHFYTGEEILETMLERVEDDELGDPNGRALDQAFPRHAAELEKAAREFAELFRKHYRPWACKRTVTEEIVPLDWIKEHHPEWLEVA